jgi:hypothetical protein
LTTWPERCVSHRRRIRRLEIGHRRPFAFTRVNRVDRPLAGGPWS